MFKALKTIIFTLFIGLILVNIFIFVAGIKSSAAVAHMEKDLEKLKQENVDLESQLSQIDSLDYAASIAASFDFDRRAVPTYLDSLKYALNR